MGYGTIQSSGGSSRHSRLTYHRLMHNRRNDDVQLESCTTGILRLEEGI